MLCLWQVRLQAMPEQACLLVSHPLLYHPSFNFFYQTVVLLCRHSLTSGAYGLALNKLMSTEAKAIMSDIMVSNSPASHGQQQSRMQPEANLDLSKDLPAATQGFPGESHSTRPSKKLDLFCSCCVIPDLTTALCDTALHPECHRVWQRH